MPSPPPPRLCIGPARLSIAHPRPAMLGQRPRARPSPDGCGRLALFTPCRLPAHGRPRRPPSIFGVGALVRPPRSQGLEPPPPQTDAHPPSILGVGTVAGGFSHRVAR
eukprot:scaffold16350_cov101-Isochrysis_galbana.AAC.4